MHSYTTPTTRRACRSLTLVLKPEPQFVLRMVAVEVHRGLVGGGEEGGGCILPAETANHGAGVQGPVAYFQEVVVGLGGEVEELNVGSWDKEKKNREKEFTYLGLQLLLPRRSSTPRRCIIKAGGRTRRVRLRRLISILTVTHWQVDSPGAVAVAGIVSRESGAQYHALHLFSDSATLSWQREAHEAFN